MHTVLAYGSHSLPVLTGPLLWRRPLGPEQYYTRGAVRMVVAKGCTRRGPWPQEPFGVPSNTAIAFGMPTGLLWGVDYRPDATLLESDGYTVS